MAFRMPVLISNHAALRPPQLIKKFLFSFLIYIGAPMVTSGLMTQLLKGILWFKHRDRFLVNNQFRDQKYSSSRLATGHVPTLKVYTTAYTSFRSL